MLGSTCLFTPASPISLFAISSSSCAAIGSSGSAPECVAWYSQRAGTPPPRSRRQTCQPHTAYVADSPRTENGIAGLTSFVWRRVMPVQRCWSAVRSGTYAAVFLTFLDASFCAERSLCGDRLECERRGAYSERKFDERRRTARCIHAGAGHRRCSPAGRTSHPSRTACPSVDMCR